MIPELLRFSEATFPGGSLTTWHTHDYLELGPVTAGHLRVGLPERSFDCGPGDSYVITSGHLHMFDSGPANQKYRAVVQLSDSPRLFSDAAARLADFAWLHGVSFVLPQDNGFAGHMKEIGAFWMEHYPAGRLIAQGLLLHLMESVRRSNPIRVPRRGFHDLSGREYRLFEAAVAAVETLHSRQGLTADDIAERCLVSRSTLDKLFRKQVGYGPKEFIQRYRVDRARGMIALAEHTLVQVAECTGFADVYHFSKLFKRFTGVPPGAYRRELRRESHLAASQWPLRGLPSS